MSLPRRSVPLLVLLLAATLLQPSGHAVASARVAGNVWTVDPDTASLVILDAGHKITVYCDADTVIRHGSTDKTLHDLHRGDRVVVTLAEETPDALIARLIAIAGAAPIPKIHPSPTPPMP